MGDPKFSRKSYDTPSHPWRVERIASEATIVHEFGLKNKTEVWKAETLLRNFRKQSRELQARLRSGDAQAKIEANALINRCSRLGLLPATGGDLNDILVLKKEDILSRRLQTVVFRKGLASTPKQARQIINHGHIFLGGHKVTVPGYLVLRSEESTIEYNPVSPFTNEMHPMRTASNPELRAQQQQQAAQKKAEQSEPAPKEAVEDAQPQEEVAEEAPAQEE